MVNGAAVPVLFGEWYEGRSPLYCEPRSGKPQKKPQIELQEWGPKVSVFANKRQSAQAEKDSAKEKELSKGFIAKATAEKGSVTKPSGLIYKQLKGGAGPSPKATDKVKVHYEGKLINGTIFDSSVKRGQPAEFPLNGVIPCWTEGVQLMKVGEKAQLICPAAIAYGDRGHPPTIPGGATLIFEVELLSIEAPAPAPATATPAK